MRRFLPCLIIFFGLAHSQEYSDYRLRYDNFAGDDVRAFQHLNPAIAKAKREKNSAELFQSYKDAVHFSPDHKITYADSAIGAAQLTGNSDIIGTAFLTKGTVYYFNYRKFKPALDEYLKAWEYIKHSDNEYLYYKNLYHIGVVKSYLGYYDEALVIFKKCDQFFSKVPTSSGPPNIKYNRKKGYLNTLHQSAACLIETSRFAEADQLIQKGISESAGQADFYLERSYFFLLQGILAYHESQYHDALSSLNTALAGLQKKDDFTHAMLVYYYKGRNYANLGKDQAAVKNFSKVDSIFNKHDFILPEVRESYEYLINYHRKIKDRENELYYTTQLLKADRIIMLDFKYLSEKLHREYDTGALLASKNKLEKSVSSIYTIVWTAIIVGACLCSLFMVRKKWHLLAGKYYRKSEKKGNKELSESPLSTLNVQKIPDKVCREVLAKLETLEKKHFYIEKGITLHKLAPRLETNSNYLSIIIKENRGCHFNEYLRKKRIMYITSRLQEDRKWRAYSVRTLANECGFGDPNNFSNAFLEYNAIKPLDYIRQLRIANERKQ